MTILYLAKHGSGGNNDEDAIAHALTSLGCNVTLMLESDAWHVHKHACEFILCHHLQNIDALTRAKRPKVFWCFDLIDWPEPKERHDGRRAWATKLAEVCDLGFCTDGDWVAKDKTGKLRWLMQGADNRPVPVVPPHPSENHDILFVGGIGYGRRDFVAGMKLRYGRKFKHIERHCFGQALAYEVQQVPIVVAPPTPVSDRYWSNRVYNILRLGGFLIHPYAAALAMQLPNLVMYRDERHLHELIEFYRDLPDARRGIAEQCRIDVIERHTYRHRCEQLLAEVRKVL